MNIEEFYDENEARRESAEIEFGSDWTDSIGNIYELSWVEATGELYLMLSPTATMHADVFFGDVLNFNEPVESLLIKIIGTIPTEAGVHAALEGWEAAMPQEHSLKWLAERFPSAD